MRIRHAIFSAIIAASIPASAFADVCAYDRTEDLQAGSLKMTVKNKTSSKLQVQLRAFDDPTLTVVNPKKSISRKVTLLTDTKKNNSDSEVQNSGLGVYLEAWNENGTGQPENKILNHSFSIKNSVYRDTKASTFYRMIPPNLPQFGNYNFSCRLRFDRKKSNTWEYEMVVRDK